MRRVWKEKVATNTVGGGVAKKLVCLYFKGGRFAPVFFASRFVHASAMSQIGFDDIMSEADAEPDEPAEPPPLPGVEPAEPQSLQAVELAEPQSLQAVEAAAKPFADA